MNLHLFPCCPKCGAAVVLQIKGDVCDSSTVHQQECPAIDGPDRDLLDQAITRFMNSR